MTPTTNMIPGDLSNQRKGRIFVISGTHAEYKTYVHNKIKQNPQLKSNDFCYVNRLQDLYGLDKVHGVFVGTYKSRLDLHDICQRIKIINRLPNIAELFPGEKRHYLDNIEGIKQYKQEFQTNPVRPGDIIYDEYTNETKLMTKNGLQILGTPEVQEIYTPITSQQLWGMYEQ